MNLIKKSKIKDNIVDSLVSQTMKNVMNCDNYFEIYNLKSKFLNAWKYLIQLELNIKISTSIKNKKIIFNKLIIKINYELKFVNLKINLTNYKLFNWIEIFKMTLLT